MNNHFDPNLLNELLDCAHNPPGGDPVLGAFYTTIVELVESDKPMAKLLMDIKRARQNITYKHITNLVFRAYQATKLRERDLSYRNFKDVASWQRELATLNADPRKSRYFKKILKNKSTTTTIYQRYTGPFALISHIWGEKEITIADLGCGGNYGLRGIELEEKFRKVSDLSPKKIVTRLLSKKINLKKGLAIDKENPDQKEIRSWRLACSFYPQELDDMAKITAFEDRIKKSKKVDFLQVDLLNFKKLPKNKFDVVILSTILYQLNLKEQLILLKKAKKLLKRNGLVIVSDFAAKNLAAPTHLDFNESWFGKSFSYRTFVAGSVTSWNFWEAFQWNNGRCLVVKPGEDFNKILGVARQKNQSRAARAAFAHSTS